MRFVTVMLMLWFAVQAYAQQNPTYNTLLGQPQFEINHITKEVNRPKRATLLSTFIPGAGQIYNGKYWKAGVVYAGAAGLIYMYFSNSDSLDSYQQAYNYRVDRDTNTEDTKYWFLSDAAVKSYRDYHRRLKDISILGFIGLYALQIIDANVDAHLHEFKVNKDLSMRIEPQIRPSNLPQNSYHGLKLSIRF